MNRSLLIAFALIIVAHVATYFQLQSQFLFDWAKRNWLLLSLVGFPISILFTFFTKYCAIAFNGDTWPGRLVGFAVGAIIFAILSYFVMKEPMNMKTVTCLILAVAILTIQIFWK